MHFRCCKTVFIEMSGLRGIYNLGSCISGIDWKIHFVPRNCWGESALKRSHCIPGDVWSLQMAVDCAFAGTSTITIAQLRPDYPIPITDILLIRNHQRCESSDFVYIRQAAIAVNRSRHHHHPFSGSAESVKLGNLISTLSCSQPGFSDNDVVWCFLLNPELLFSWLC